MPTETNAETPSLPTGFCTVESSNINAVAWLGPAGEDLLDTDLTGKPFPHENAQQGKLGILFKNGTRYDYQGVPRDTVQSLLEADSIGKAFNANVRGHKEYHASKVDPETGVPLAPEQA